MKEKKKTKQGILTEYSVLQWRVTRIPVSLFVSVPCFRCCTTKKYFDLKRNMSIDDFLCNKKYSVCTLAKECVLCTKMLTFLFSFLHHLCIIQSKFNAYFNFHDFLRPFNYHYLNAPFYFSKNNVETCSVV